MGTKAPNSESLPSEGNNNNNNNNNKSPPRRSSFGLLLRRTKSTELKGKKAELQRQELARLQRAAVPAQPPSLPRLYNGGQLPQFGGQQQQQQNSDHLVRDSVSIMSNRYANPQHPASMEPGRVSSSTSKVPIPPIPTVDPYARTESMTHRGRYSYASSAVSSINSPRRVRRRKDPTPFK